MSEISSEHSDIPIPEPSQLSWKDSTNFDELDWMEILESADLKEFSGEKRNAATILSLLGQGVRETFTELSNKGLAIPLPEIGINPGNTGTSLSYDATNNLIIIALSFLETLSAYDLEKQYQFYTTNDEVCYRGKLKEWVLSMADEETHHAFYTRFKDKKDGFADPREMTLARYDASPIERRGQRWVRRMARKRGFSQEAQEFLEQRYVKAGEHIKANKIMPENNVLIRLLHGRFPW